MTTPAAPARSSNSTACLEGTGATCSTENNSHLGKCNSPRVVTFSGGQAPRGSVLLVNSSSIGLLMDGAACTTTKPMRNGKCQYADYGPDCLPCTDDDLEKGTPNIAPTTSGTAAVAVYDVNDMAGDSIKEGATCGGTSALRRQGHRLAGRLRCRHRRSQRAVAQRPGDGVPVTGRRHGRRHAGHHPVLVAKQ